MYVICYIVHHMYQNVAHAALSSGDSGRQRHADSHIVLTCFSKNILRIYSASKRQKIKNIEPESEKQYPFRKRV